MTTPTCRFKCAQEFVVQDFKEHLNELHDQARPCYLINVGRPSTVW